MTSIAIAIAEVAVRQGNGLYSLNDLHKAAGGEKRHQPSDFLRIDQTQALIAEIHSEDPRSEAIKVVNGGRAPGTYACRELVYAMGFKVVPEGHKCIDAATYEFLTNKHAHVMRVAPQLIWESDE